MELLSIAEAYEAALGDKMLFEQRTWHVYYWLEMQLNQNNYLSKVVEGKPLELSKAEEDEAAYMVGLAMNIVGRYDQALRGMVRAIKKTQPPTHPPVTPIPAVPLEELQKDKNFTVATPKFSIGEVCRVLDGDTYYMGKITKLEYSIRFGRLGWSYEVAVRVNSQEETQWVSDDRIESV